MLDDLEKQLIVSHATKAADLARVASGTGAADTELLFQVQNEARAAFGTSDKKNDEKEIAAALKGAGLPHPEQMAAALFAVANADEGRVKESFKDSPPGEVVTAGYLDDKSAGDKFRKEIFDLGTGQGRYVTDGADAQITANYLAAKTAAAVAWEPGGRALEHAVSLANAAADIEQRRGKGAEYDPAVKDASDFARVVPKTVGDESQALTVRNAEEKFLGKLGVNAKADDAIARAQALVDIAAVGKAMMEMGIKETPHSEVTATAGHKVATISKGGR